MLTVIMLSRYAECHHFKSKIVLFIIFKVINITRQKVGGGAKVTFHNKRGDLDKSVTNAI
jgi:hypothetical protein